MKNSICCGIGSSGKCCCFGINFQIDQLIIFLDKGKVATVDQECSLLFLYKYRSSVVICFQNEIIQNTLFHLEVVVFSFEN